MYEIRPKYYIKRKLEEGVYGLIPVADPPFRQPETDQKGLEAYRLLRDQYEYKSMAGSHEERTRIQEEVAREQRKRANFGN